MYHICHLNIIAVSEDVRSLLYVRELARCASTLRKRMGLSSNITLDERLGTRVASRPGLAKAISREWARRRVLVVMQSAGNVCVT
jgi:hypothetical protein